MNDKPAVLVQSSETFATELRASSHLTVVETVYYQPGDDEATSVESQFCRELKTQEQPYVRILKVGPEWQKLDCGWVDKAGMLVLINEEGRWTQVQPTDEERWNAAGRIVELTFSDVPEWLVLPGESFRGHPASLANLRVRCRRGTAKCSLHLFPGD